MEAGGVEAIEPKLAAQIRRLSQKQADRTTAANVVGPTSPMVRIGQLALGEVCEVIDVQQVAHLLAGAASGSTRAGAGSFRRSSATLDRATRMAIRGASLSAGPVRNDGVFARGEGRWAAHEDIDFCLRAWQSDYRVLYCPAALL